MSHIPLLRKDDYHHAPRLQAPRRGPQLCFCALVLLLLGAVVATPIVIVHSTLPVYNDTAVAAPPAAVQRVRAAALAAHVGGLHEQVAPPSMEDLIASVGWLLERSLAAR